MTTQESTAKKSFFLTYFLYKVKKLKTPLIINSVFSFLAFTVTAFSFMMLYSTLKKPDGTYMSEIENETWLSIFLIFAFTSVLAILALFFVCIAVAPSAFNYHNKRFDVDLYGSLPLTRIQRFWSDFLAGLTVVSAPLIINILISSIFARIGCDAIEKMVEAKGVDPLAEIFKNSLQVNVVTIKDLFGFILIAMITALAACVSSYIFSTFISSICGKLGESISYSILFTITLPGFVALLISATYKNAFGVDIGNAVFDAVSVIPPIGLFIDLFSLAGFTGFDVFTITNPIGIAIFLSIDIALLIAAYFLSIRRKAENTGKPFAYKSAYFVLSTLIILTATGAFLLGASSVNWSLPVLIAMIVFTAIMHFIFEVVNNRGIKLKQFLISIVRYIAIMALSTLLFVGLISSKAFGAADYIPDTSEISEIYLSGGTADRLTVEEYLKISQSDSIKLVTDVHKTIIENKIPTASVADNYTGGNFKITYKLKNGSTVERNYINPGEVKEFRDMFENLPEVYDYIFVPDSQKTNVRQIRFSMKDNIFTSYTLWEGSNANDMIADVLNTLEKELMSHAGTKGKLVGGMQISLDVNYGPQLMKFINYNIYDYCTETINLINNIKASGKADCFYCVSICDLTYNFADKIYYTNNCTINDSTFAKISETVSWSHDLSDEFDMSWTKYLTEDDTNARLYLPAADHSLLNGYFVSEKDAPDFIKEYEKFVKAYNDKYMDSEY